MEDNQLTSVNNVDEKKEKSLRRGFWATFIGVVLLALVLVFEIVSLIVGF